MKVEMINIRHILHPFKVAVKYLFAHLIVEDEAYIKIIYKHIFHRKINLDSPVTFNEKLNWLKLHDRHPIYSKMADKYDVKAIVADKIGADYVVPNYGVWKDFDEIDFDALPDRFVLKCTHDSGGANLCWDKSKIDKQKLRKKLNGQLKKNYSFVTREWVYKDANPRIIADKLLDDHSGHELTDYKWWCFNGVPKVMYITNKGKHVCENFYDMNFAPLDVDHGFPRVQPEYSKPLNFELMKSLAARLSEGIPFVRIDFFIVNEKVYFGEYTFYDWAGLKPFVNQDWDIKLGSWIQLPHKELFNL